MNEQTVLTTDAELELTKSFDERHRFNVSDLDGHKSVSSQRTKQSNNCMIIILKLS